MENTAKIPVKTYVAKLFEITREGKSLKVAGTLDGSIDLATPRGTFTLSLDEARQLIAALKDSITDVSDNCLYERDDLLEK